MIRATYNFSWVLGDLTNFREFPITSDLQMLFRTFFYTCTTTGTCNEVREREYIETGSECDDRTGGKDEGRR